MRRGSPGRDGDTSINAPREMLDETMLWTRLESPRQSYLFPAGKISGLSLPYRLLGGG